MGFLRTHLINGLNLVKSKKPSDQYFGWGAITRSLKDIRINDRITYEREKRIVEEEAIKANNYYGLKSLLELYKEDISARDRNLFNRNNKSSSPNTAYSLSVLSEFYKPRIKTTGSAQLLSHIDYNDNLVSDLIINGEQMVVSENKRLLFNKIVEEKSSDYILLLLLLSKNENVRRDLWVENNELEKLKALDATLYESYNRTESALDKIFAKAALDASLIIAKDVQKELSMPNILNSLNVKVVKKPNSSLPNRGVLIKPKEFVLSALYKPIVIAWNIDWEDISFVKGEISSKEIASISERESTICFGPCTIEDSDWRCLSQSMNYIGATFSDYSTSSTMSVDAKSVPIYGFGIEHRIWMPVLDPNNGAKSWGDGRPKFIIQFAYKPQYETLFVAVRWHTNKNIQAPLIKCLCGSLYEEPIAIELGTGWNVYCVNSGEILEFQVECEVEIQSQITSRGHAVGYSAAVTKRDFVELLELDLNNSKQFEYVKINTLEEQPEILTVPSQSMHGLLTYAASLTRAVNDKKWPVEIGFDAVTAAAYSMTKMALLSKVITTDFSTVAGLENDTEQIPWKERQKLLKHALPLICYKTFEKINEKLSLQLGIESKPLLQIKSAQDRISNALKSVAHLTTVLGNKALTSASRVAEIDHEVINDINLITTALYGAKTELNALEEDSLTKLNFGCRILNAIQFDGYTINSTTKEKILTMESDKRILKSCIPSD